MKFIPSICMGAAVATAGILISSMIVPTALAQNGPQDAPVTTPAPASNASSYNIDETHSMALFRVQHLGAGPFWGRFNGVSGTIEHDPSSETGLRFDVAVDIASVDTGNEGLDDHLKGNDFFDLATFEAATFKSTSAKLISEKMYEVKGTFSLLGVSKDITAQIEWVGTKAGNRGERCGFEATFTITRSDFGMLYGVAQGALGDEVRIVVGLEAIKAEAGGQGDGGGGQRRSLMERFDTNGDGKIQKDELPERMRDRFDDLDVDDDGTISEEELKAIRRGGGRNR